MDDERRAPGAGGRGGGSQDNVGDDGWQQMGTEGRKEKKKGRRESSGEDNGPLMNERIDFFDFWDWVPERERNPPEKEDWDWMKVP